MRVNDWTDRVLLRRTRPVLPQPVAEDAVTVALPMSTVTLRRLDPGVHAALLALPDATTVGDLVAVAVAADPGADLGRLGLELGRMWTRDALRFAVLDDETELCDLVAANLLATCALQLGEAPTRYRLSRFALLRRADDGLLVDSLAANARATVRVPALGAVLTALHQPCTEAELSRLVPELPPPVLTACLRVLHAGGALGAVDDDGLLPEDHDPGLAVREPHDLYLHARSRTAMTPEPVGGTYRRPDVPPLPALRTAFTGPELALPRPDLTALAGTDPAFVATMEHRRSDRAWADRPLTLAELGEFLHRVFRVRRLAPRDPGDPHSYEITARPIPSAGGAHDLEVYLVPGRVAAVDRALYHYDPQRHVLTTVTAAAYPVQVVLDSAMRNSQAGTAPPVVFVLASRFARLSWKYEGMAYAATLKNVGVAYGAMYLAATAMGLAGCALGTGDAVAFGVATRTAPHVESPVGEFVLGPRS